MPRVARLPVGTSRERRSMQMRLLALILVIGACASTGSTPGASDASPEQQVWVEFVRVMQSEPYPAQDIRPYYENLREPMAGFLEQMRAKADWREWHNAPRVFRVEDHAHFIIPLTFDGQSARYSFSFVKEGDRWHFQHLEAITLPFDELGELPLSGFPDLPAPGKAYIREEIEISKDVRFFNTLAALRDTTAALDWFKDGRGYALTARAWIPFVPPPQAFILYACWEQANLRGNEVVLERLDPDFALIRIQAIYFRLYENAAHLKQQISPEHYWQLYETRWQNRAMAAGWDLDLSCAAHECTFRFTKAGSR
jgi:hypothetical protein